MYKNVNIEDSPQSSIKSGGGGGGLILVSRIEQSFPPSNTHKYLQVLHIFFLPSKAVPLCVSTGHCAYGYVIRDPSIGYRLIYA